MVDHRCRERVARMGRLIRSRELPENAQQLRERELQISGILAGLRQQIGAIKPPAIPTPEASADMDEAERIVVRRTPSHKILAIDKPKRLRSERWLVAGCEIA